MSRFYELHLEKRQLPAVALRNAQLWLRNATIAELQNYVSAKARDRSLSPEQVELIQSQLAPLDDETQDTRLFAAPRHWGAFVVYGE